MKLIESLNRIMAHPSSTSFKPRPTIDDWIAGGNRRSVEFKPSDGRAIVGGRVVDVGPIRCELTGYAGAVLFSVKGYGDTSGDALINALSLLSESGVPA